MESSNPRALGVVKQIWLLPWQLRTHGRGGMMTGMTMATDPGPNGKMRARGETGELDDMRTGRRVMELSPTQAS